MKAVSQGRLVQICFDLVVRGNSAHLSKGTKKNNLLARAFGVGIAGGRFRSFRWFFLLKDLTSQG
jgi:hypothetical protein